MSAKGYAPGKIILLGEHAVLYGEPAIGIPLSRGVHVEVQLGNGTRTIEVNTNERASNSRSLESASPEASSPTRSRQSASPQASRSTRSRQSASPERSSVTIRSRESASPEALIARAFGARASKLDITVHFEIPPMSGMGSSAAFAVALLRARAALERRRPGALLEEAIAIENVAHGKSSGLDPAIALASGPILYRTEPKRRTRAIAPQKPLHLVVGARGGHGGTGRSIGRVREFKDHAPRLIASVMHTLGRATETGAQAIRNGDLELLGRTFDLAHGVLSGLGLVSKAVDEVVCVARQHGALGSKMSGAGGEGGAFVALATDGASALRIQRALKKLGAQAWCELIT